MSNEFEEAEQTSSVGTSQMSSSSITKSNDHRQLHRPMLHRKPREKKKTDLLTLIELDKTVMDKISCSESEWIKCKKIGEGASSYVYKFKNSKGERAAGKKIHIKLFNLNLEEKKKIKETLRNVLNEIKVLADLDHENIIKFFGCLWNAGQLIILMELMPLSVKEKILEKPLTESECINYALQTAKGLQYLHGLRPNAVVHRDIKCENLLLTEHGIIKLTDFGLAFHLALNSAALSRSSKAPNSLVGTYLFMAPELLREMAQPVSYGRKSDIWSFACTIVQMITCYPPLHKKFSSQQNGQILDIIYVYIHRARQEKHWLQYTGEGLAPDASAPMQKLLNCLFVVDEKKRPSIDKILSAVEGMSRYDLKNLMELHEEILSDKRSAQILITNEEPWNRLYGPVVERKIINPETALYLWDNNFRSVESLKELCRRETELQELLQGCPGIGHRETIFAVRNTIKETYKGKCTAQMLIPNEEPWKKLYGSFVERNIIDIETALYLWDNDFRSVESLKELHKSETDLQNFQTRCPGIGCPELKRMIKELSHGELL